MYYTDLTCVQFSAYFTKPGDYALSKDLDVDMWIQYRDFCGKSALVDVVDFVIVDIELHNEFDQFKKAEVKLDHSFVPISELLLYYCLVVSAGFSVVSKYGKDYLEMHQSKIDDLISWVYETRKHYSTGGEITFSPGVERFLVKG